MLLGDAVTMLAFAIVALLTGVLIILFRNFAVWWASEGPMSRLSPTPPSRRAYEIAFIFGGIICILVGLGTLVAVIIG
jgi:hypothetical protein